MATHAGKIVSLFVIMGIMWSFLNKLGSFAKGGPEYGSQEWYKVTGRDPRWVAVDEWTFAKTHNEGSTPSNEILERIYKHQEESRLPDISVSPSQGKYIQLQAKLVNAQHILEVGTLGAYSTIFLAGTSPTTRVTTIESVPLHVKVARENIEMAGLGERIEVIHGKGIEVLPALLKDIQQGRREKFDFVFIDADKLNNLAYFDYAANMARPGACIIVDNVVRRGAIIDLKLINTDETVIKVRELITKVGADPRVDSTVLQMVGDKNYDGMLIAVVGR
ncbi:O-methyltransferase-domain-containing protein [Hypomontagnella monticulosa]|nr:O-methyltransferase-domain-containing protein [Hypomontagnella monticulosa]